METDPTNLKTRSSYNVAGMSFAPEDIAASIQKHLPDFTLLYAPDERQKIANSWPESIDDSVAREHWGWKPQYDLQRMSDEMILQLKKLYVNQ
jgi:nucleoside-diphosphate-sugar epimerase